METELIDDGVAHLVGAHLVKGEMGMIDEDGYTMAVGDVASYDGAHYSSLGWFGDGAVRRIAEKNGGYIDLRREGMRDAVAGAVARLAEWREHNGG